jgi:predicted protein tyrosine phosphatase
VDRFASFQVSICGVDDLPALGNAGVTHVLSLLNPGWGEPEHFRAFAPHRRLDLRFHDIVDPLPGLRRPGRADVAAVLEFGRALATANDAHLLVHCEKGLSRSSACLALILAQARHDLAADAVLAEVVRLRPRAWPNLRIIELGDEFLGRGGSLVAAAVETYRARLVAQPRLADGMIEMGRARELHLARG